MGFNPNFSQKSQEVIFSQKLKRPLHNPLMFNNQIKKASSQKHLGIMLDETLSFE